MSWNNNNLYPPTLPTYGETFILGENYKLFFSISKYNSSVIDSTEGNIASKVQVVLYKQNTNISAVDLTKAPCEILCKTMRLASEEEVERYHLEDRKYCIEISSNDLKDGNFLINTYYRLQIRFMSSSIINIPDILDTAWLTNNEQQFSEWSTVCLIREISPIEGVFLNGMDAPLDPINVNNWTSGEVEISGTIKFQYEDEKDTLRSYYIKFFDINENLIWDSGEIFNQPYDEIGVNEFHYTVNKIFQDGERYILKIGYTTRTLYSEEKTYQIFMMDAGLERLNVTFTPYEDAENGRILLNIKNTSADVFNGNLIIRRSCGDSDFTVWEDVAIVSVENTVLNYTFYDYTIQSGKWYRYGVQTKNNNGQRGLLTICKQDLLVDFEDIFLNAGGKQLCIKYNPQISSFQKTFFENKVDTIGGKYPIIKRNGSTEYKQFPISGLITYFMDKHEYDFSTWQDSTSLTTEKNTNIKVEGIHNSNSTNALFEAKEDLYPEEVLALYDNRNSDRMSDDKKIIDIKNFSPWQDVNETIYEKDFRDKVMDFLYSNDVKLYRSATEGNILIKLMNVTFTPNQTLGRKVWTFNATAYEIDECSLQNFDKYGIQKIGSAMAHFEYVNNYLGQIEIEADANQNIITNYLQELYNKDIYHKENYKTQIKNLNHIKIQFLDKPYLIDITGGEPTILDSTEYNNRPDAILGHIIYLNGKSIVVRNSTIYELEGEDIQITSISFPVATKILLDYKLALVQIPEETVIITSFFYINRISQLYGLFNYKYNLVNNIQAHFNLQNIDGLGRFYQALNAINGLHIEANEGSIIYVKESNEDAAQKHIIGPTRTLDFWDPDSIIMAFSFGGKHVVKATDYELQRDVLMANRYVDKTNEVNPDLDHPIKNGLYIKDNKKQIWHENNWYECTESGTDAYDIQCPVAALVDYYCELIKGYYAK